MSELVCEALATKAELQELRDQINNLLGQPELGGEPINVLESNSFAGTLVGAGLFYGFEIIEDSLKAGKVQISRFVSNGGKKLLTNASNVFSKGFIKANLASKAVQTTARIGSALAGSLDIIASVGLNIATLNTLGYRIDQTEKLIRSYDVSYSSLIKILNDQNEDIDAANLNISELAEQLVEQQGINQELVDEIDKAQVNIDELAEANEAQDKTIKGLLTNIAELKTDFAEYEAEAIAEINSLKAYIESLEKDLKKAETQIENLYTVIDTLATNLADYQARMTEVEIGITKLELQSSIQIAELANLKIAIEQDQELTDARLDSLEAQLVLANSQTRSGGGSLASSAKSAIAGQQVKTLELMNSLSTTPVLEIPQITYSDIVNNTSAFDSIFEQLLPGINTAIGPGGEIVNADEIVERVNNNFNESLVTLGIAGLPGITTEIRNNTTPQAISSATSTAICQSTASGGCMNNDVFKPLKGKLDDVVAGLGLIGEGANLGLNNSILNRVTDIQTKVNNSTFGLEAISNFMKNAWENAKLDKVLNVLNTVLALHNALMLSRNLAQTLGDVTTQALQFLGIKDAEGQLIDVNEFIGNTMDTWITNLVGTQTYANIQQTWTSLNRIMVAAQGVVYAVQGVKNAVLEGLETVGSWTAKIGNNMMIQGLLEERSFPWMNENVNLRNPFSGFIQKIDRTEEIVSQVNNLVSSGIEAQDNFNQIFEQSTELKTASQQLQDNLSQFDTDKEGIETQEKANSASPDIDRLDLIQLEPDEI